MAKVGLTLTQIREQQGGPPDLSENDLTYLVDNAPYGEGGSGSKAATLGELTDYLNSRIGSKIINVSSHINTSWNNQLRVSLFCDKIGNIYKNDELSSPSEVIIDYKSGTSGESKKFITIIWYLIDLIDENEILNAKIEVEVTNFNGYNE